MKTLLLALQFLTIIPIRMKGRVSEQDIAGSSACFPVVGFLEGLLLAALSSGLLKLLSPSVTSALVIIIYLVINGGFHQDGLSDTFDALSVKSTGNPGQDRQKRLAIMRDSTSGPVGITAIAIFLLLKYTLLKEILEMPAYGLSPAIVLMPMISAWSMTMMMPGAKSARDDGLGKIFLGRIHAGHILLTCILLTVLSGAIYLVSHGPRLLTMLTFMPFFAIAAIVSLAAAYAMRLIFTARFGGLTGDNLGCIHEISEIVSLLAAVLFYNYKCF